MAARKSAPNLAVRERRIAKLRERSRKMYAWDKTTGPKTNGK
jgi:hypothetical protein